jgi:hypothetical protein
MLPLRFRKPVRDFLRVRSVPRPEEFVEVEGWGDGESVREE